MNYSILIRNKKWIDKIAYNVWSKFRNIEYGDLKQEAFLKAMEVLPKYNNTKSKLTTFLHTHVTGYLVYQCKKQSRTNIETAINVEITPTLKFNETKFDALIAKHDSNRATEEIKLTLKILSEINPVVYKSSTKSLSTYDLFKEMRKLKIGTHSKIKEMIDSTQQYILAYGVI